MSFLQLLDFVVPMIILGSIIGVTMLRRSWTGSMVSTRSSLVFFLVSLTFLSMIHAANNLLTSSNLIDSPLAGAYMLGSFIASISLVSALNLALGPYRPSSYFEFLAFAWRRRDPYILLFLYTIVMGADSLLSYFPWVTTVRSPSFAFVTLLYLAILLAFLARPMQRLLILFSQKLTAFLYVIMVMLTLTLILGGIYFQLAFPTNLQPLWDWGILALSLVFGILFLQAPFASGETLKKLLKDEKSTLISDTNRFPRSTSFFSHSLGLSHHQLLGGKFLLNIEPISQFEESVKAFIEESRYFGDRVIVLTHSGSSVQEMLQSRGDLVIAFLSPDTASIKLGPPNAVVLPIHNVMQISTFLATIFSLDQQQRFSIVLDSISYVSTVLGFSKAYKTLRRIAEVTTSPRVTVLALVDPQELQPVELASFRELLGKGGGRNMHA